MIEHLASIGLINFEFLRGYELKQLPKSMEVVYKGQSVLLTFFPDQPDTLQIGHVRFTNAGNELARICNTSTIDGFVSYVIGKWNNMSISVNGPQL